LFRLTIIFYFVAHHCEPTDSPDHNTSWRR